MLRAHLEGTETWEAVRSTLVRAMAQRPPNHRLWDSRLHTRSFNSVGLEWVPLPAWADRLLLADQPLGRPTYTPADRDRLLALCRARPRLPAAAAELVARLPVSPATGPVPDLDTVLSTIEDHPLPDPETP